MSRSITTPVIEGGYNMSILGDALIDEDYDIEYFRSPEYLEKQIDYWKSRYELAEHDLAQITKRYSECRVNYHNLLILVSDLLDIKNDVVNSQANLSESQRHELAYSLICSRLKDVCDEIKK